MNFREFLDQQEMDLIAEELELNPRLLDDLEQYDEIIGSALKFAAGAGGNFVSQLGRGVGNAVNGAVQGTYGATQAAAGALQFAGGGGRIGKETFKKGMENLKAGTKDVVRGAIQGAGALTGITPALRGAQAMSEPIGLSGVYAPAGKGRSATQDLLGLNAWKGQKASNAPQQAQQPPQIRTGQKQPQQVQQPPQIRTGQKQPRQVQQPPQIQTRQKPQQAPMDRKAREEQATKAGLAQMGRAAKFKELVAKFNQTKDRRIQRELMTNFPREYKAALIRAQGARGARTAQAARESAGRQTRTIGTATA